MCRSVPAFVDVIFPKFASWRLLSGKPNCGVLNKLNDSPRNSNLHRSVNAKSLKMEKSNVFVGGPLFV